MSYEAGWSRDLDQWREAILPVLRTLGFEHLLLVLAVLRSSHLALNLECFHSCHEFCVVLRPRLPVIAVLVDRSDMDQTFDLADCHLIAAIGSRELDELSQGYGGDAEFRGKVTKNLSTQASSVRTHSKHISVAVKIYQLNQRLGDAKTEGLVCLGVRRDKVGQDSNVALVYLCRIELDGGRLGVLGKGIIEESRHSHGGTLGDSLGDDCLPHKNGEGGTMAKRKSIFIGHAGDSVLNNSLHDRLVVGVD